MAACEIKEERDILKTTTQVQMYHLKNSLIIIMTFTLLLQGCFSRSFEINNEDAYHLFKHYTGHLEPEQLQWNQVLNHRDFYTAPILVIESIAFKQKHDKVNYLNFMKQLEPLLIAHQGHLRKVLNIIFTGVGEYSVLSFDEGLTTVIEFPSRAAYIKTLSDFRYIKAYSSIKRTIKKRQLLIGKDTRPAFTYWFNTERKAEQFQLPIVDKHPHKVLLEKLLTYFPDNHSDPQRHILERMFARKGFRSEPIYLMNLYDLGDKNDQKAQQKGKDSHFNYYKDNIFYALSRGIKTQFIARVEHVMVSQFDWDIVALNYWPSLANFTDFRLIPHYYKQTHQHRLNTGRHFGNLTHTLYSETH